MRLGASNPAWKGGRWHDGRYAYVRMPGHPRAKSNGYVAEHVVVAERALGKYLPGSAHVHHVNGIKDDNRPANLVICEDASYHQLLHARAKAIAACGRASWRACHVCRQWDDPAKMSHRSAGVGNPNRYAHLACARASRSARTVADRIRRQAKRGVSR